MESPAPAMSEQTAAYYVDVVAHLGRPLVDADVPLAVDAARAAVSLTVRAGDVPLSLDEALINFQNEKRLLSLLMSLGVERAPTTARAALRLAPGRA